jgi:hypothetical protein
MAVGHPIDGANQRGNAGGMVGSDGMRAYVMTNADDESGRIAAIRDAIESAENAGDADLAAALLTEELF